MKQPKTFREVLQEKDEELEAATKRHRPANKLLRQARGTTVSVGGGIPESHVAMGNFVRASSGRLTGKSNGEDSEKKISAKWHAAAKKGIVLSKDGETVLHDFSKEYEDGD